jgi:hypothetical protein
MEVEELIHIEVVVEVEHQLQEVLVEEDQEE